MWAYVVDALVCWCVGVQAARILLKLDSEDPKRRFEGDALLRRMVRYGLLGEEEKNLDDVLRLSSGKLLERRLQTMVFKEQHAKSIHQARVYIRQRHIRVGRQLVNVPSFTVRTESQGHIDLSINSPYTATGRPGRVARKRGGAEKAGDESD